MSYGDRVKQLRAQLGMTQDELARLVGIPSTSLSRLETDERNLKLHEATKLAQALGVDLYVLAGIASNDDGMEVIEKDDELAIAIRKLRKQCPRQQQRRAMAQVFYALGKHMDMTESG